MQAVSLRHHSKHGAITRHGNYQPGPIAVFFGQGVQAISNFFKMSFTVGYKENAGKPRKIKSWWRLRFTITICFSLLRFSTGGTFQLSLVQNRTVSHKHLKVFRMPTWNQWRHLGKTTFRASAFSQKKWTCKPLISFLNFPFVDHSPIASALTRVDLSQRNMSRTWWSESNLAVFRQLAFQTSQQCNTFQFEIFIHYKMSLTYIN